MFSIFYVEDCNRILEENMYTLILLNLACGNCFQKLSQNSHLVKFIHSQIVLEAVVSSPNNCYMIN